MSNRPVSRRAFVGRAASAAAALSLPRGLFGQDAAAGYTVSRVLANFEREPLIRPSGFKGGYMTEFWQNVALIENPGGTSTIGLGTQNVLWCDPEVLAHFTESGGNSLMFAVTDRALQMVEGQSFASPIEMLDQIFPELFEYAKEITGMPALRPTFVLNALISVDNAAWLLYAANNGITTFDELVPQPYRPGLSYRHRYVASLPSVTYGLPLEEVVDAAEAGYFIIKLKLGHPGSQEEMLRQDIERTASIVKAIDHLRTPHTPDGKLRYDLDPNARYEAKETLLRLLDACEQMGILDRIVVVEEPFPEEYDARVDDIPVLIAADESATTIPEAIRRFDQGYRGMALKAIAKTLSQTMKIAQLSHERGVHCMAADLTVNPILVDWNKNVAARLAPLPGVQVGMMETNGHQQYLRWEQMERHHPCTDAPWRKVRNGVFEVGEDFYARSGCIFLESPHYRKVVTPQA